MYIADREEWEKSKNGVRANPETHHNHKFSTTIKCSSGGLLSLGPGVERVGNK